MYLHVFFTSTFLSVFIEIYELSPYSVPTPRFLSLCEFSSPTVRNLASVTPNVLINLLSCLHVSNLMAARPPRSKGVALPTSLLRLLHFWSSLPPLDRSPLTPLGP